MKKQSIKSLGLALLALVASSSVARAQTYQLPNVGFENWGDCGTSKYTMRNEDRKRPGSEPIGWSSQNVTGKDASINYETASLCENKSHVGSSVRVNNKKVGAFTKNIPYIGILSVGKSWYDFYYTKSFVGTFYEKRKEKFVRFATLM